MPRLNANGWKRGDLKIHTGTLEDIPKGWTLAAEFIDRAIVGAGGIYVQGQKFGADSRPTENRTLSAAHIPHHGHSYDLLVSNFNINSRRPVTGSAGSSTGYTHGVGGNAAHNHGNIDIRQQSIAVIWIRKL